MRTGRAAALTDTGRRRMRNEDTFVCEPPLFAVADGMGGAQAGELASRLAAAVLEEVAVGAPDVEAVAAAVREANARVFRRALEDPHAAGMGTTVTVAVVDEAGGRVAVAHVGDSRAYRLRADTLEQLTQDHSLVAELMRSGRLTEDEAAAHPQRSVITRALGTEPDVDVDADTHEAAPGDLYLLCSDGLTSMLRDGEILAVLEREERDPERVANALVAAANDAGGEDNITVVVFEIAESAPEARIPPGEVEPAPSLERTAEDVAAPTTPSPPLEPSSAKTTPGRRFGAGRGSRWSALALILLVLAAAVLLLYLGLAK